MKVIEKHKKAIMVAFFFFVFTRLKNNSNNSVMSSKKNYTKNDAKEALLRFSKKNYQRAKLLEKMYILETGKYTSKQFRDTGTAGMEDGAWGNTIKKYFPNGYNTVTYADNHTKKPTKYIVWNNLDDYLQFWSDYIDRHNGDYLDWNSLSDQSKRASYQRSINLTKNEFIL